MFADALPHVPDHRRLPVLTQLVTTLGPARFLWVLMLLLFKLHATQTASSVSEKARRQLLSAAWSDRRQVHTRMSGKVSCQRVVDVCVCVQDAALERDVDFWISLCCQFEVTDQLTSLISILNFLLQLPDDKDDGEIKFRLDKNTSETRASQTTNHRCCCLTVVTSFTRITSASILQFKP